MANEFEIPEDFDLVSFFHQNEREDGSSFALKKSEYSGALKQLLAEQLSCRKKVKGKIPRYYENGFFVRPLSLEQSSSEAAAIFKKSILSGKRLIDLTGGLGVDALFLSEVFSEVVYCEKNSEVSSLVRFNFKKCRSTIEIKEGDGVEILSHFPDDYFDWIYVDPSRRVAGKKIAALSESEPNIPAILPDLFKKGSAVCIKASPLYDCTMATRECAGLESIVVVSIDGECRELLLICHPGEKRRSPVTIEAVMVDRTGAVSHSVKDNFANEYSIAIVKPGRFLLVPDPAVIKAGLCSTVAHRIDASFIHKGQILLTKDEMPVHFPGRVFSVVSVIPWSRKTIAAYCKERGITKANIATYSFPATPDELKKKLGLFDGGEVYFFFTVDNDGNKICIHGEKVHE